VHQVVALARAALHSDDPRHCFLITGSGVIVSATNSEGSTQTTTPQVKSSVRQQLEKVADFLSLGPVERQRRTGSGWRYRLTHKEVFMKDQVRGKAEEIKGKVTGDRGLETKGKARQAVGNLKRTVRDVKGDVRKGGR
jgi:uncharacterized protein YjbJ (UPF0337 family)